MPMIEDLEEIKNLLQDEARSRIPLSELIEAGRTDEIIERGAQKEAKAAIMAERDTVKRQRLIISHLPLFGKERR